MSIIFIPKQLVISFLSSIERTWGKLKVEGTFGSGDKASACGISGHGDVDFLPSPFVRLNGRRKEGKEMGRN